MYFLLGICLTLALLLMINIGAATLSLVVWRLIAHRIDLLTASSRARIIFALRFGPVLAGIVAVCAFVVPAYLLHEPENSGEVVSIKLALMAIVSLIAVCIAICRCFKGTILTGQLAASWRKDAEEITIPGADVPVFRITHPFPVMAVVGIIRPRIFVAEQVLQSLSDEELRAAVAHEYGHLRARDNLKRTILRACRDLVVFPLGTSLDRAWEENAEQAADEYAANSRWSASLNLASALVKLARIAPHHTGPAAFYGSYLNHGQTGDVTARVRRLLWLGENAVSQKQPWNLRPALIWSASLTVLLALHLTDQRLLLPTHQAIEVFVRMIL